MKAVILCWWSWTRMLPLSKAIPKELLPIWKKPLLAHSIEALLECWVKNFLIVSNYQKKQVEDFLDINSPLKNENLQDWNNILKQINIAIVKQKISGTAWAILECLPWLWDEKFLVLNGDMYVSKENFFSIINKTNISWENHIMLNYFPRSYRKKYRETKIENWKITSLLSTDWEADILMASGVYTIDKKVFDQKIEIVEWTELGLPRLIENQIPKQNFLPLIVENWIQDFWDINSWLSFIKNFDNE